VEAHAAIRSAIDSEQRSGTSVDKVATSVVSAVELVIAAVLETAAV
jgi:hypothetical protein